MRFELLLWDFDPKIMVLNHMRQDHDYDNNGPEP